MCRALERASRLGLNEAPTEFPAAKMRGKEKGRWAEGSGSESGHSAPAGPRGMSACSPDPTEPAVIRERRRGEKAVGGEECVAFGPGLQLWIQEGQRRTCQPSTCVQRPPCTRRRPPLCGREIVHFIGRFGVYRGIMCVFEPKAGRS